MALTTPCIANISELVFQQNGLISTKETFLRCLENIPDAKLIPLPATGGPLGVSSLIQLNNIGTIDPAGALIEVDFFLTLYWQDDRFAMPAYWDQVDNSTRKHGVKLDRIFFDSAGQFIWLPDIFFHDIVTLGAQVNN